MTVAFVERKLFGGMCVNTGCTPTKTLIASAYAARRSPLLIGSRPMSRVSRAVEKGEPKV